VQLLGSGTILREVIAAAALLTADFGVAADIWSAPSFTELRREGLRCQARKPGERPAQTRSARGAVSGCEAPACTQVPGRVF
jgi:pyruvate dehydrogenase complex dehydrogenase (E1) component